MDNPVSPTALRGIAQRIVDGNAREDESLGEHILALCRAYLALTEPNAAAPDLLEALKQIFLLDKCPNPGDGCSQCIARAAIRAAQDVSAAETRLLVLGIVPMSCGHRDVERLVDCLSPAPETWCSLNTQIAVLVRAAEKLTEEVR